MNYWKSMEQNDLSNMVRKFAEKEIRPLAAELDETETYCGDIIGKLAQIGLHALNIPENYGGSGLDTTSTCLVLEQVAWGCAGVAVTLTANTLAAYPILLAGSEEQKYRLLSGLGTGRGMAAFCITEPNTGSDVAAMATTARRVGNRYLLNGRKCFISNAGIADFYIVFAATDREKGHQGISAFVVPEGTAGFKIGKRDRKMGIRSSVTAEVIMEDVPVPPANLLGREGQGFKLAMETLDCSRPAVGAISVGLAQAALDAAVSYAKIRKQFGTAIANFQAVQLMIADMQMQVEAARQLVYLAASKKDRGLPFTKEAAMAKAFASDAAMKVTTDALQVYGAYGYMRENPVEKYMRDAKIMQIFEGTNQIQRLVIAREIFSG